MANPHITTLKLALEESASSRSRMVILEGPAGCGKTKLLRDFSQHATSVGAFVLRARALPTETSLPLSLMRQLLDSPSLPEETGKRLRALLDDVGAPAPPAASPQGGTARMQRLWTALRELMATQPMLICVDGLQHVDATSLEYLLYIAGRSRATRLMMAATEAPYCHQQDHTYRTEFLRLSHLKRLRVACLERREVASLIAEYTHAEPDETTVRQYHVLTGGNPLLLRALLAENAAVSTSSSRGKPPHAPHTGAFPEAVLTCLASSGPAASAVADGLAVLGTGSVGAVSQLCGVPHASTDRGMRALEAAGIIRHGRFRHPAARESVLERMEPERRRQLHRTAAVLLRAEGAAANAIAPHVVAAGSVREPWEVTTLQEAAEEVLFEGRRHLALQYLDLARRLSTDGRQRTSIRVRTAIVLRHSDPPAGERVAEELLRDLRSGRMAPDQCRAIADLFRRNFRFAELDEVMRAESELRGGDVSEPASAAHTWALASYEAHATPPHKRVVARPLHGGPHNGGIPLPKRHYRRGTRPVLRIEKASAEDIVAVSEAALRRSVLNDSTLESILTALRYLLYGGRIETARHWCDLFRRESLRRKADGWYALLSPLRADIALHLGKPADAEAITQDALSRLSGRKSSVLAGGLVGLRVMAQTALGQHEASVRELNRPPAESLFGSGYGLMYLRARGLHSLATRRPHVALDDFLTAGRMAIRWSVDDPAWLPWRGDAAEACLLLGHRAEAERLVTEQLAMTGGRRTRARGMSLRLLGAVAEPQGRLSLLTGAVRNLQAAGDRVELARALLDLGEAHRYLGETTRAEVATRRAWQLARECGAEPLCARLRQEHDESLGPQADEARGAADAWATKLSDSERKVAVLAASGFSNRDISTRLHITVSTVEQHLTRIYRKLDITGRRQLPPDMPFELGGVA